MKPLYDTFITQLYHISKQKNLDLDPAYFYGRTGMGARFSLAMNTKTAKEIGHPSSHYIWDIVGVVENCFPDTGIEAITYVGPGYVTRARETAAQSSRELPDTVLELDDYTLNNLPEFKGDIIYAHHSGEWRYTNATSRIDTDSELLPFGPVIFLIKKIVPKTAFPSGTMRYIIDTLERGEAPMEIRGKGDYSAVSGWKAYARWMQSFSVPLPKVQHEHLSVFPQLLIERRKYFVQFLRSLSQEIENTDLLKLVNELAERYQNVVNLMDKMMTSKITLQSVREIYFTEQKTQTIYKKLNTYLTYQS